jgi:threonyl-tRNA synthetase
MKKSYTWNIYNGRIRDKDYSMRVININSKDMSAHFPYKAGIAIPFNWTTETGMPSNVELESLNKIEDYLSEIIGRDKNIMVAVVTGNNVEEFVFYTSDPKALETLYKDEILDKIKDHKSQFYFKEDRNWDTYLGLKGQ